MQTFRNPAKSRPLSANVKRLMRLARASPQKRMIPAKHTTQRVRIDYIHIF